MHNFTLLAGAVAAGLIGVPAFGANIILNNVDPPGAGFNDPTAAAPVGGNTGTTVGAQRLIAYQRALDLWGSVLKSDVTIVVQGSFRRLNCTATGGTLAQAGANQIFADFPNAPLQDHWFGVALANSIASEDLAPGGLDPGPQAPTVRRRHHRELQRRRGTARLHRRTRLVLRARQQPGPGPDRLPRHVHARGRSRSRLPELRHRGDGRDTARTSPTSTWPTRSTSIAARSGTRSPPRDRRLGDQQHPRRVGR